MRGWFFGPPPFPLEWDGSLSPELTHRANCFEYLPWRAGAAQAPESTVFPEKDSEAGGDGLTEHRYESGLASGKSHRGLTLCLVLASFAACPDSSVKPCAWLLSSKQPVVGILVSLPKTLTEPQGFLDSPNVVLVLLTDEERKFWWPQRPSGNTYLFCQGAANMGENLKNGKHLFFIDLKLVVQIFVSLEV